MVRLNSLLLCLFALVIYGCSSLFGDSYEEDVANDREVLNEIIRANPKLQSAMDSGHYFLPTGAETGRITGSLDLGGLGLNDSNFYFPKGTQKFRIVNSVSLTRNDFTELPRGTRLKNWTWVLVLGNKMCNPSQETIAYLDKLMAEAPGGYWRDSQRCGDAIPAVSL